MIWNICVERMYAIHKFHCLNSLTGINQLFHDILIIRRARVCGWRPVQGVVRFSVKYRISSVENGWIYKHTCTHKFYFKKNALLFPLPFFYWIKQNAMMSNFDSPLMYKKCMPPNRWTIAPLTIILVRLLGFTNIWMIALVLQGCLNLSSFLREPHRSRSSLLTTSKRWEWCAG